MKKSSSLGVHIGLLSAACAIAAACGGDDKPTSFVAAGGTASGTGAHTGTGAGNGTGNSGGDSGIHLAVAGDANAAGGDAAGGAGGANCGFTSFAADPPVVNVLLVVDKSGSMSDTPAGFKSDKWTALRTALDATFTDTKTKISYGLDLFPFSGKSGQALANSCEMPTGATVPVPVQAGTKAAPLILAALDANPPEGGTPTAAALARALAYYTTGAGKALGGDKYVLLATDGGPNCDAALTCAAATCTVNIDGKCPAGINCCDAKIDKLGPTNCLDDAASVAAVTKLSKAGIKTIVLGIPGTEAYTNTLDAMAAKSGVVNPDAPPAYFAVSAKDDVTGLSTTLETITTGLIKSCELHMDSAPPDFDKLFVVIGFRNADGTVDPVQLTRDGPDGWTIPDPTVSPPVIEVSGATCQKLEAQGAEFINVTYGCPNTRPPVK
jgi:hypothetical protein